MKRIIFVLILGLTFLSINIFASEESIFVWGETDVVVLYGEELTDVLLEIKSQIKLKEGYEDPDFYVDNNNVNYTTQSTINTKVIKIYRLDHRAVSPKYNKKEIRSYYLHIVDKEPPIIIASKSFTMPVFGTKPNFIQGFIATDNVTPQNELLIIVDDSNVNYNAIGTYEIIYTVLDEFGNSVIHLEELTIVDLIKPTITQIKPLVIQVNEEFDVFDYFVIEDNYDKNLNIYYEFDGDLLTIGAVSFTITVKDNSNNTETFKGEFLLVDEIPPVITLENEQITLEVYSDEFDFLSIVEVSDNCDELTLDDLIVIDNVNYEEVGVYEVIYNLKDNSDNQTTEILTVLIQDKTSPSITVEDITLQQNEMVDFLLHAKVEDNYSSPNNIALRIIYNNVNYQMPGIYYVTYEAVDESGNHTHETINVTIIGKTKEHTIFYILVGGVVVFAGIVITVYFIRKRKQTP